MVEPSPQEQVAFAQTTQSNQISNNTAQFNLEESIRSAQAEQEALKRRKRLDNISKSLDSISGADLAKLNQDGKLTEEALDALREINPQKYQDMLASMEQNKTLEVINKEEVDQVDFITQYDMTLEQEMNLVAENNEDLVAKYKDMVQNSAELTEEKLAYNSLESERKKLKSELDNMEDDVREELGGRATESYIAAEVRKRSKLINREYNDLINEMQEKQANIQAIGDNIKFDYTLQAEEIKRQDEIQWRNLQFKYNITKDAFDAQQKMMFRELDRLDKLEDRNFDASLKDYFMNKELDEKIQLSQLDTNLRKDLMKYQMGLERQMGTELGHFQTDDGKTVFYDKFTGNTVQEYDPNDVPQLSGNIISQTIGDKVVNLDMTAM